MIRVQVEKRQKFYAGNGRYHLRGGRPGRKDGLRHVLRVIPEPVAKIPNHRILAINRGEKEKKLKVNA